MNDLYLRGSIGLLGLAILGGGLWLTPPQPAETPPLASPDSDPYVVCSVGESGGGFTSRLGIVGQDGGRLIVVGGSSEPLDFEAEEGHYEVAIEELAELGVTPVLVEAPAAAATYSRAGAAAAVGGCGPARSDPLAVLGMSTAASDRSTLMLVNPFAVEASLRLTSASEFGVDTPADLERVRVPPFTSIEVVLDQVMAGRQSLTFSVSADTGLVAAGMLRKGAEDVATAEAVPGSTLWYFPLPDFGLNGQIQIRALADVETAFRIDRIEPEGLVEGVSEGAITPQGLAVIPVEEVAGPGMGIVIATAEPVGAALTYATDEARAVTPGATREAVHWVAPVSSTTAEGQTTVWILNLAGADLTATVQVFGSGSIKTVELAAGMTTGVVIRPSGGQGIEVTADGSIVVFYGVLTESAFGVAPAIPVE